MKSKFCILVALLSLFVALMSCTSHESTTQDAERYDILVSQAASSTTGITISWIDTKGDRKNYTVSVYKDQECKDLYQEYTLVFGEADDKRFSIPYLDSVNAYYICVTNALGCKSKIFEVQLESPAVRRSIVVQNFDNLFWGYDYINYAHGVKLSKDIDVKTYLLDNLSEAIGDSQPTTKIDDDGGLISRYHKSMRELMGMGDWPTTSKEVRILPGYIKLGAAFQVGILHTPTFAVLGDETEVVDVSFDAAVFSSALQADGGQITASIKRGDEVVFTKNFNMKGVSGNPSWNHFKFTAENVTADCYLEIHTTDQAKQVCIDNIKVVRHLSIPEGYIYGYTYDRANNEPIEGVAISDGFSVVTTDKDGFYLLKRHQDAMYVYYSVPADCEVIRSVTGPRFYTKLESETTEYSFGLSKLAGGKEEKFALFTFADPQVSSNTALSRFKNEAVPAIKEHSKSLGIPCYGITLGDVVSTSDSSNSMSFMEPMREAMRSVYIGMAVYQVMGNHDSLQFTDENPLPTEPDANGSNFEVKAQRAFEKVFGPINYSFDRGDIHIVGMRDIVYTVNNTSGDYETGFLPEQYEWLKQDLALVPKDKMVVLCVHIPLHGARSKSGAKGHYVKEVHQLLNEFKEAHIISGHTHLQRNFEPESPYMKIYEHNMGTVCGTWWASNVCGCGTPNGYGVFIGENGTFTDWYYMGYNEGMNSRDYQMRLYRGNAITGAEKGDNKNGKQGYYAFNYADDVILANVFNADSAWRIEVYEDEIFSGEMELLPITTPSFSKELVGDGSMDDPYRVNEEIESSVDMWVAGFHLGVLDRYDKKNKKLKNGSWTSNSHMYKYQLSNPEAKVKVIAIDRFGRKYESDKFVDYKDNSLAAKP